ncbi:ABC transporter permease [Rhodanobacter sp. Col0626]|uniref:ABC transporter permease n=1 Tax=Rhodanobacter sp. Col0626 TaxID=3415679 RepID=UPI003CF85DB0
MHPILSALKHHKTVVALVALEIALTCAIVSNALFIIGSHLGDMQLQTGVADNELVWATSSGIGDDATPASQVSRAAADLAALRAMPGVKSAVITNSLPLSSSGSWGTCIARKPGGAKGDSVCTVILYAGTAGVVNTLGIKLSQGRDFLPQEYQDFNPFQGDKPPPPSVIVTRSLAQKLWPGEDPLGKPVFLGDKGSDVTHVVGVTDHFLNPDINKSSGGDLNLLFPVTSVAGGKYVLRTEPGARDTTLRNLAKVLDGVDDQRIITGSHSYADTVSEYFHDDRALIWLLLVVIGCLLALTALGVVGLSSFWVQQRTHQIGIRRAIGATRHDILRYFQLENFLIVSGGIAIGLLLAVALNLLLMKHYELPRLPLYYLPAGAVVLWLLGQLAVLGPALRAAAVPPVVATRSV